LDGAIPAPRTNALVRELHEELGIDLVDIERRGGLVELTEIGYAVTPPFVGRRFATWFYRLRLADKPMLTLNTAEHTSGDWATPAQWLEEYMAGELLVVPPTLFTLQHLAEDSGTPWLTRFAALGKPPAGYPLREISPLYGVDVIMVRSNTLPPAKHTNCFVIGDGGSQATRLVVDPAPRDDDELDRLYTQVRGRVDAIFITHHHIDHSERANVLARRCDVPVLLSADTQQRIAADQSGYFRDLSKVQQVSDGDVVTYWGGHAVRALAVPGHDAGQLALLPDNRAWCLVGDLIQGIGSVVIAPPEGDMAWYCATLEKVIALGPRAIFPSHGLALGGTHYLQAALDHRREREKQILQRYRRGVGEDDMLDDIYAGTPGPLLPYARTNIRSHLAKLRAEGAID
jgi:glyoxylase-like metal-dependent hydrolase (beta-lactamase superfamily II)